MATRIKRLGWFVRMMHFFSARRRRIAANRSAGSKKAWATRRAKVEMKRAD